MKRIFIIIGVIFFSIELYAQQNIRELSWHKVSNGMPKEWYASAEAAYVAKQVITYQTEIGGWPKNMNFHKDVDSKVMERIKASGIGATFDNGATIEEMRFLAKVYECQRKSSFKESFIKGLEYIFKAQYTNGGWPQFFPVRKGKSVGYSGHITYNDGAYINVMNLLKDIIEDASCFRSLEISNQLKEKARNSFNKGLQCILDTQIKVNGNPTVWCAQHDSVTLLPAKARAYELPSFSGAESAGIVLFLMSIPHPSAEIIASIQGAVRWFESHMIKDVCYERYKDEVGERDSRLVPSPGAHLWARFYDLDTGQPYFCDRDGIKKSNLNDIGKERRGGYSWYTTGPSSVLKNYQKWSKQHNLIAFKPRILVSTDIGGSDPDDNQSMTHLLMMNDRFQIEGLVSSPSNGSGSKEEILRMIDLYAKDFQKLRKFFPALLSPDSLKTICRQGRKGISPYLGYGEPTEGSDWIVQCARRPSDLPLWILVWGTLEDVAQALHDAPDIADKIKIYWIGGPNKKWGTNSYTYIAKNFPNIWFIENNASYRGFIGNEKLEGEWQKDFYAKHVEGAGHLGKDFVNYYHGMIKMGDTPSLLYLMNGNPNDPTQPKWGGQFEHLSISPYRIYNGMTSINDTIPVYGLMELQLKLSKKTLRKDLPRKPFTLLIDKQEWDAVYIDDYAAVRYTPKAPATLHYKIISDIKELQGLEGDIVVSGLWPGNHTKETDIPLGRQWYTDMKSPDLFQGVWQGAKTISIWREQILQDWSERWAILRM